MAINTDDVFKAVAFRITEVRPCEWNSINIALIDKATFDDLEWPFIARCDYVVRNVVQEHTIESHVLQLDAKGNLTITHRGQVTNLLEGVDMTKEYLLLFVFNGFITGLELQEVNQLNGNQLAVRELNLCPICLESRRNGAFVSCGHCVCFECANFIREQLKLCPACRAPIEKVIKLFI